ncbi:MAG: hypothetical protein QOI59_1243 [Gammaproteobacteria bacterium]|jgi:hypothetical protein|nr:hypothetical protein [Gammaproteobacteria bacterium]
MELHESHQSAAADKEHVAAPVGAATAAEALERGPIGALTVSVIAVGLLFLGWMLFYFLLFMGRGPVG